MRTLILIVVALAACSPAKPAAPVADSSSYIRVMSLPDGAVATIECDTGKWHGTIRIAADVKVGYTSTSTTTTSSGTKTKTTITVNGRECVIDATELRVGEQVIGPLSGEVLVEIRADGVFVNGTKRSDL